MKGDEVVSVQGIPVKGMSPEKVAKLMNPMRTAEDCLMSVGVAESRDMYLQRVTEHLEGVRKQAKEDNAIKTQSGKNAAHVKLDIRLRCSRDAKIMGEAFESAYAIMLSVERMAGLVLADGDRAKCRGKQNCGANYWSLGIIKTVCQAAQYFFFDNDPWSINDCSAFYAEADSLTRNGMRHRLMTLKEEQDAPTLCRAAQSAALPSKLMTSAPPGQTDLDK